MASPGAKRRKGHLREPKPLQLQAGVLADASPGALRAGGGLSLALEEAAAPGWVSGMMP